MVKLSVLRQARRAQDRITLWRQLRRQVVAILWQVPMLAIFSASAALGVTLLDFEDLPPRAMVKTQYGPRGVIFGAEGSAGHYLDQ